MSDSYVGEIRNFGFTFAPQGWAMCNGQLLPIAQNTALFALIGTFYGGDGITTYALPDLRGRVAAHQGTGSGLSPYTLGEQSGNETHTLNSNQMPQHTHQALGSSSPGSAARPAGAVPAHAPDDIYAASPDGTALNAGAISSAGGSQPFNILQPYLVTNFCIALFGVFPTRN